MFVFLAVVSTFYGLLIGSFLNVVVYRVPRDLSIVRPPSACPRCSNAIAWYDNIPVVSWLVLRAKCRHCGEPISSRYILVELTGGAIFLGSLLRFGVHPISVVFMAFFSGLLALALIDLEHLRLPTKMVYTTTLITGVLLIATAAHSHEWHQLVVAAACGVAWFVSFFALNFFAPKYLGFGDVRLSFILGLTIGWLGIPYVLFGFFAANLIGALIAVPMMITHRLKSEEPIPYGVFLSLGAVFIVFVGPLFVPQLANLLLNR